jgi:5'-AMP-activated protein kinase, catalytic alpha subunit
MFAILCGSLPFDDENIRNLFKKIKAGQYSIPSYVSPSARDLLSRMLVIDPLKRATMKEVMVHPWFKHRLPPCLTITARDRVMMETGIDASVLQQVKCMHSYVHTYIHTYI